MIIPIFKKAFTLGSVILVCLLTACNNVQTRLENADEISFANNFIKKTIQTERFNLVSYQKATRPSKTAVIYIEGDGFAWKNKYQVSANPTPNNPVALKLAAIDTSSIVIYIARPCQFINIDNEKHCHNQYWTYKRASQEVIESINAAIDKTKAQLNFNKIRLVGYSGGATIAAVLAATRDDIIDLRSVAGNLDIEKFVEAHKVTPLTGSINPISYANKLYKIPQSHFISVNDTVITKSIINSYIQSLKSFDIDLKCINVSELTQPEHSRGWETSWANQNFNKALSCHN